MMAPSHGTKMSRIAQPAFAQPLSEWSPNRSNRQRNHTIRAAIQMKNQKLHRRTSPKSVVIASMSFLFEIGPGAVRSALRAQAPRREGPGRDEDGASTIAILACCAIV